ncbi:DMT family transporter [Paraburkholderia terrae]|uniref:EamA/RhaT family transporter n=1 Tax=Paraburkholderia terrae TaxID=311230 RepID=A0A2I8F452_9BURK|nr:DMT family transporter [Paraburkholderia terrae]AUT65844.1 EamA/RhaT family transporter [Paraburkholderia terrae]
MRPYIAAFTAIILWSAFATLSMPLRHLPPLLVTGLALLAGSLVTLRHISAWKVRWSTFIFGSGCLFLYHFCLLKSFTYGSVPVANLINYTWPFLLVLMSSVCNGRKRGCFAELTCCAIGFIGCAVLVLQPMTNGTFEARNSIGYGFAAAAAVVWAGYTFLTPRFEAHSAWAVGGFCAASGLAALAVHAVAGPSVELSARDVAWIAAIGVGPLGIAFVAWNHASRFCDPGLLGSISYLCPPLSLVILRIADPTAVIDWMTLAISMLMSVCGIVMSQHWRRAVLSS